MLGGLSLCTRPLNDIDLVAAAFDCAPETLARDSLFRHVHPLDAPGKTILQLVDVETALRIDLFQAYGAIMTRARPLRLQSGQFDSSPSKTFWRVQQDSCWTFAGAFL